MLYANFNTYGNYVTDSLYQWDKNQDLVINGLDLSVAPEIHFANANMERAIVRQSTLESGVVTSRIPNSLLQEALAIKAYVGIYKDDTFNVIETIEIPVFAKPRPTDYTFEDSDGEIYSYNALENRIDNIIANANSTDGNSELVDLRVDYKGNIHASAGDATRFQTRIAEESANAASVSAQNAKINADLTENSAKRAENAANEAEELVESLDEKFTAVERRLETLENEVVTGFETDSSVAYSKTVPENVLLYAELEKSGVNSRVVKSSNFYKGDSEITFNPPYTVGEKIELGTMTLKPGTYIATSNCEAYQNGSFLGGADGAFIVGMGDSNSQEITLETTQTVTLYAVVNSESYNDYDLRLYQIGVYDPTNYVNYEPYFEPYISTAAIIRIESTDPTNSENNITYDVPENIVELQKTAMSGEGSYGYDYFDWASKKLYKYMKPVDLASLTWSLSAKGFWIATIDDMKSSRTDNIGIICEKYTYSGAGTSPSEGCVTNTAVSKIYIKDSRYTTVEDFIAAVSGIILYYELKTPDIIDIDTGDFDRFIKVYPNGKVNFKDTADSTSIFTAITYQLKEV